MAAKGISQRNIAQKLGIARGSVATILGADRPKSEPEAAATNRTKKPAPDRRPESAESAAPDRATAATGPVAELLATVRGQVAFAQAEAQRCIDADDAANGAKFSAIAARLAPTLASLEKAQRADREGLFIPAEKLANQYAKLDEMIQALCQWGIRCADCGRIIRTALSDGMTWPTHEAMPDPPDARTPPEADEHGGAVAPIHLIALGAEAARQGVERIPLRNGGKPL